jgi:glycosyltransferase involved in cell wall biosynthesis
MNILMISDVYFPRVNGVSTSIQTFRRQLERLGHPVTLIAPDYGRAAADEGGILRIPARRVVLDPEDRMMRARAVFRRLDTLARQRFDIIHIQTPFVAHHVGVRLSRRLNIPRVESYHTFFEEYLYHYVPIGEEAARQKPPQLSFGVGRDALFFPIVAAAREEGLQVVLHRPVEWGVGGAARLIRDGRASRRLDGHGLDGG